MPDPLSGAKAVAPTLEPDFVLAKDQTHDQFSRPIEPALRVPSGSTIEAFTHEATGGQFKQGSIAEHLRSVGTDRVHTLTGPVHVEGAEPGDVLAVRLLELEPDDRRWMAVTPDFGPLAGEMDATPLQTFKLDKERNEVEFAIGIRIPLKPFAGVMGVAPETDEMLNTIPPGADGGNLDDPNLQACMLASLAGDLEIAEAVNVPQMLVAMHMPKHFFTNPGQAQE